MDHNCETGLYEVKLKIIEGSAMSIPHRAQLNAQISIVVPTGDILEVVDLFSPIQNNQAYDGTVPARWLADTPVVDPAGAPGFDYYAISPVLAPAAFYNNIEEESEVLLFTVKIGESDEYDENVQFYNNDLLPSTEGFGGADFRNGMTIGGALQLYSGNEYRSCSSVNTTEVETATISAFPNPFGEMINVLIDNKTQALTICDYYGKTLYSIQNPPLGNITIPSEDWPAGSYLLTATIGDEITVSKIIKQ